MGFKVPRRTATLQFEGAYEGAEIYCRLDASTETYLAITRMQRDAEAADNEDNLRLVLAFFVEHIATGWNLEDDDGTAIPLTIEALMQLPANLSLAIIPAWKEAATGVPAPLGEPSTNGNTSPVEQTGEQASP